MLYKKKTRYSKYKPKIKWTLTHVQVIANMRQTLIEHEIVIITISLIYIKINTLY